MGRTSPGRTARRAMALLALLLPLSVGPAAASGRVPTATNVAAALVDDAGDVEGGDRVVVGGCTIGFDTAGVPSLRPSQVHPCVGVESVDYTGYGDLRLTTTDASSDPVVRLTAVADADLMGKGVLVGASLSSHAINVRMYDDVVGRRLDLRSSTDRARLGGGRNAIIVGWVREVPGGEDVAESEPGFDAFGPFHDLASTDVHTVAGGCVIRFSSDGPRVHANGMHTCVGVASVGIVPSNGRVRMTFSSEQYGSVVNFAVDADETLTQRGIVTGATATASRLDLRLYDTRDNRPLDMRLRSDRDRVAGVSSNAWVSWTKTLDRPGALNATNEVAPDKYGPYMNGSAAAGAVQLTGCEVRFSGVNGAPELSGSSLTACRGVREVTVASTGALEVLASQVVVLPVIATTTVSSRALTDYGIRAGASGGSSRTLYRFYSVKLGRTLNLNEAKDRVLLQRSGSSLHLGWTRDQSSLP